MRFTAQMPIYKRVKFSLQIISSCIIILLLALPFLVDKFLPIFTVLFIFTVIDCCLMVLLFNLSNNYHLKIILTDDQQLLFFMRKQRLAIPLSAIEQLVFLPADQLLINKGFVKKDEIITFGLGGNSDYTIALTVVDSVAEQRDIFISVPDSKTLLSFLQQVTQLEPIYISHLNTEIQHLLPESMLPFSQQHPNYYLVSITVMLIIFAAFITISWKIGPAIILSHRATFRMLIYALPMSQFLIFQLADRWKLQGNVNLTAICFQKKHNDFITIPFHTIQAVEIADTKSLAKNTTVGMINSKQALVITYTPTDETVEVLQVNCLAPQTVRQLIDIGTSNTDSSKKISAFLQSQAYNSSRKKRSQHYRLLLNSFYIILIFGIIGLSFSSLFNISGQTTQETASTDSYRAEIDVFQYAHLNNDGIEGQVALSISRSRNDNADTLTPIEMEYINAGKFFYQDHELPQKFPAEKPEIFPLYNGDTITIRFEPNENLPYEIMPITTTKIIKLKFIGNIITSEKLQQYTNEILTYDKDKLNRYIMMPANTTLEKLIYDGKITKNAIYYKLETHYSNTDDLFVQETSALTLLVSYEYEGVTYLRGNTNIYGWSDKYLSYGNHYYFEYLELTEVERLSENIEVAINQRGFEKINI